MRTKDVELTGHVMTDALSSSAIARRHLLLKGLGRGAAVLTTAVPLQTLAAQSVFTNPGRNGAPVVRCGISGMTSGVHSADTTTTVCSGYSPDYYQTRLNWPSNTNPDATCVSLLSRCTLTMPSSSGAKPATLLEVMVNYPDSAEFHWIGAWLNGMGGALPSWNFPFTGQQILDFYNGIGPYTADAALNFIKTYLEIHP